MFFNIILKLSIKLSTESVDKVLTHYTKTSRKAVYNISMPDLIKVVFDIPINDSFDYISDE